MCRKENGCRCECPLLSGKSVERKPRAVEGEKVEDEHDKEHRKKRDKWEMWDSEREAEKVGFLEEGDRSIY